MDSEPFHDLMARLAAGDGAAAALVFHKFAYRLVALARSRLDPLTRRKIDPEDVLQSVFRSFFVRHAAGQFELDGWDSLWGMLVVFTLRKCGRQMGYYRAARRNLHRESATDGSWLEAESEPTPAEAAVLSEMVDEFLLRASDNDRPILVLTLQGFTAVEIGTQVGCTERTVRRVLARARQRLQKHYEPEKFPEKI